jgi:hypothetical protein
VTSLQKPSVVRGRSHPPGFLSGITAIRNRSGHQTSIGWIVLTAARRRRLSCSQPASPKTVRTAASQPRLRAESRLRGVWREPVTTAARRCARAQALAGLTRMSLAGYSLAGWSPPEPASASPAEKIEILTWIDLHAWENATLKRPPFPLGWPEKRGRRPAGMPPVCEPPPAWPGSGGLPFRWPSGKPV